MKNTDLISIIGSLDATKATGLDGITPNILKKSADIVNPSLLKIINISISTGQFPDLLKVAKIIPIHKSGAQDDPANYRPISILSIISKVIEKHVTKHLFAYLNKYSLLHKSQSGFRKHHSCNTALINLIHVDRWLNSIDKGDIIGAVFFDLRKAFDVVDHDLLLQKLAAYKFSTTSQNWIQLYLTNRKKCIVNQNIRSSLQIVKSGVPQGSVLGPVLFLLFVNDLPLFIKEVYLDLYADDATVHASGKKQNVIELKLQTGTDDFKNWCLSNHMFIHIGKTSLMTAGSRQTVGNISMEIFIDREIIKEVENQKLPGVIIDKTLSWDKQIDAVCLNVTRRITLMKLLSKYLDQSHLNQYYNSYVLPIFDYACLIWGRCTVTNMNRLIRLQKRAARIVLKADFLTPSHIMFNELKWLSFPKRAQYHTCIMMYKTLHGSAPEYMSNLFVKPSEVHNRNLRSIDNETLRIPYARTNVYDRSFAVTGAREWNALPYDIKRSGSIASFKFNVKQYLL